MTFKALQVEYWIEEKVKTVLFGNEMDGLVLLLANVPDTANHYVEWKDQSHACYNGVQDILLTRESITVRLLPEAAATLGESSFEIQFQCEEKIFEEIAQILASVFREKISIKQGEVPKTVAPKKDYSAIKYLNLEGKNLKNLPDYVAEMSALETAKLRHNPQLNMQEACKILAGLPALKQLEFSTEQSIPEEIGALSNLESLHIDISHPNGPCTIPDSISGLQKLTYIFIQTNNEIQLPDSFAELSALEDCYLRAGKWNLPKAFYRLSRLKQLDFTHCVFNTLAPETSGMEQVEKVIFGSAETRDYQQVMSVIAQLPNLKTLEINFPQIPAAVGLCRQIEELIIWAGTDTPLTLPDAIFSMDQLKILNISLSRIEAMPEAIGQLKGLKELIIQESVFDSLPESIGNLGQLELLNISENPDLSSLPESLGLLSNLKTLYLVDNPQLTVLPDSLKNLQNLESVYIPDREALQNIPAHWEQLFE